MNDPPHLRLAPGMPILSMLDLTKTQVHLECPSCGKTGAAVIVQGSDRKSVDGDHGFTVAIAKDNSLQIVCPTCHVAVYEAK